MAKRVHVEPEPEPEEAPIRKKRRVPPDPEAVSPVEIPTDAAMWQLKDEKGERLSYPNAQGAYIFDWPVREFTAETIRHRWGGGTFLALFTTRTGQPRGRKRIQIVGKRKSAEEPPAEVVETPRALAVSNPMVEALNLMAAIDNIATNKSDRAIERDRQFLAQGQQATVQLFAAAMGRETSIAKMHAQSNPELDARLGRIESALAQLLEDDGEGPEDEEPELDEDGKPIGPAFPDEWDSVGQMLYRVLARQMPHLDKLLPKLVGGMIEKIQQDAARAAASAAPNGIPVAGGEVVGS